MAAPAGDVRPGWRAARGPLLLVAALVAVAVVGVLVAASGNAGALDPDGTSPEGSRALAVLLRDRGVRVERVTTVDAAVRQATGRTTIFVPLPDRVLDTSVARLRSTAEPATLVLVNPDSGALRALGLGVRSAGRAPVRDRVPSCDLPAAAVAGSADLGGATYDLAGAPEAGSPTTCYPAGGKATVVAAAGAMGDVTIVGTSTPFTNAALDERGNAALALGLLGAGERVVWLLPRPAQAAAEGTERHGLLDLLPGRLLAALAQVAFAVLLLALWRARRLGPVVSEPLPVVVRSAEAVEGRGRLYRAAGERASAAAALRGGSRARLAARLGLPPEPAPEALADAVAGRTPRGLADVATLLYGAPSGQAPPAPPDDAALVALATDLDTLEAEVRRP